MVGHLQAKQKVQGFKAVGARYLQIGYMLALHGSSSSGILNLRRTTILKIRHEFSFENMYDLVYLVIEEGRDREGERCSRRLEFETKRPFAYICICPEVTAPVFRPSFTNLNAKGGKLENF